MEYRVVLVRNGVYKKTLHRCKTRDTAYLNYHIIRESNKVLYPRKYINTNGIIPVKYHICITKETEDTDVFRTLRDEYGKSYVEKPLGEWTIIDSAEFLIEETFWLLGLDPKTNRVTISEIIKRLVTGAHSKNMVKQIIVVHNKLIIYNEDQFDMVICKNMLEAQRLHHTLAKIAKKQKIKSLMFMGTATAASISLLYELIHEKTKWPYTKIRRRTTRP